MRDYDTLHYIDNQITEENKEIKDILKRAYQRLDENKMYSSCLSTSVMLCLAIAYKTGKKPELVLGSVYYQGIAYSHAWIEINEKVYDLAIGLDSKYHPVLKEHIQDPVHIKIGTDRFTNEIKYYPYTFNDDWPITDLHRVVGKTLDKYIAGCPTMDLYEEACYALDMSTTKDNMMKLKNLADNWIIKDTREDGYQKIIQSEKAKEKTPWFKDVKNKLNHIFHKQKTKEDMHLDEDGRKSVDEWLAMVHDEDKTKKKRKNKNERN